MTSVSTSFLDEEGKEEAERQVELVDSGASLWERWDELAPEATSLASRSKILFPSPAAPGRVS